MTIAGRAVNTKAVLFFTLFYLISLFVYWIRPWGSNNALYENIVYVLAPFLAAASCLFLSVSYGMTGKKSLMFFALSVGLVFLFAGDALYVFYDFFLNEAPFPTIADVFYLLSYPFIVLAMLIESRFMRISLGRSDLRFGHAFLGVFAVIAMLAGYFGVYAAYSPEEPLLNNAIAIGYGLGDLLIVAGAMYLLFLAQNLRRSSESYFWTGIVAGFGSITAADIMFAKFNDLYVSGNFLAKNIMDSFWILGYVTIAFFLLNFALTLTNLRQKD